MSDSSIAHQLAEEFVILNEYLRKGGGEESASQRLVDLAITAIPGCQWAGVTVWPAKAEPHSLTSSGDVAATVDRVQHETREGPCLMAADDGGPVHIADLRTETRWPTFCSAAADQSPVRSVLSYRLTEEPRRVALNFYGGTPSAFGGEGISAGALFATHARGLLLHEDSAKQAATLSTAVATNRQIGAAIGILMHANRVSYDEAFEMLRTSSQHLNRKLRDVASDVRLTGALP